MLKLTCTRVLHKLQFVKSETGLESQLGIWNQKELALIVFNGSD